MKRTVSATLYNVIFPIWMLWMFPAAWLVILPANLLIDFLVARLSLGAMKVEGACKIAKSVILRIWLMGFVADFAGTALMVFPTLVDFHGTAIGEWWYANLTNPVSYDPFASPWGALWVTMCVALSAVCIYWLNRKFSLKKTALTGEQKHKAALALALFTAPYLFYLPTAWFY